MVVPFIEPTFTVLYIGLEQDLNGRRHRTFFWMAMVRNWPFGGEEVVRLNARKILQTRDPVSIRWLLICNDSATTLPQITRRAYNHN